jgi:uncharacterized membrane protein
MAAKTFGNIGEAGFWWAMTVLSLALGGYALFLVATGFDAVGTEIATNPTAFPVGLPVHISAAAFALILGPFQFLRSVRTRAPRLHRWTGRGYITACLIGGVAGGSIALGSTAGPVAGWGFLFLAVAWVAATLMAWTSALRRDFTAHERWMVRSFALAFAAVTLRIYIPLGIMATGGEFFPAYRVIAWASWVPNLVVAEAWLWAKRPRALRVAA